MWFHMPHRKQMCKRKYLLIWELVLLKHAFCGQERGARSADLAVNRIVQPGVLCSIGMDFAPQHGSNSTPIPNNWGFWFSLKWILPALYRPFSFLQSSIEKKDTYVQFVPFLVSVAQTVGEVVRLFWVWKLWTKCWNANILLETYWVWLSSHCVSSGCSFAGGGANKIF